MLSNIVCGRVFRRPGYDHKNVGVLGGRFQSLRPDVIGVQSYSQPGSQFLKLVCRLFAGTFRQCIYGNTATVQCAANFGATALSFRLLEGA